MCRKFAITGAVHCTDTAVAAIFQRHRTFTLSRQGFITPATHRFSSVDVKVPLMKPRKASDSAATAGTISCDLSGSA